jgi:hypothetical protein
MTCVQLTVLVVSFSICRPAAPRLRGEWVGTMEDGGGIAFVRARFDGGEGVLHVGGRGRFTLARAAESGDRVAFEMRHGSKELLFVGVFSGDSITGTAGASRRLKLHRLPRPARLAIDALIGPP